MGVKGIGYDSYVDDLSSVDSKGLSDKSCEVLVRINKQSPDIAGGVHVGKTQVTIEYLQKADGSVEPKKIHTVVISTQHAEPLKATRKKEVAGYTGPDATAPSMAEMNKQIEEKVIRRILSEITLKSGERAITLYGDHTHLHINPSG